jgi:hypothetical protein
MTGRSARPLLSAVILCLPALAAAQVFDGLTIYNRIGSRTTYLVDNSGRTVASWSSGNNGYISYLLPDSSVWRMEVYSGSVMRGGPYGGLMQHYDWTGSVFENFLWSDSNHQQHHDINVMPNGHVLVVSWDRKTEAEARALGRQNITGDIWPDEVVEWAPEADSAVWQWHFWDHLIQDVDPQKPNYGVVREHPELLDINLGQVQQGGDWMHCNTVDYNEERDEVIITSHTLHEVYVVDHSTTTAEAAGHTGGRHGKGGDFLYRWGNPQNYDRGTAADQVFFVAHGANWIRPGMSGAGDILMLNNGDRPGNSGDSSSVLQITPPLDANDHYYIQPDSAYGPRMMTWQYSDGRSFYSQHLGGAYRLPNGNTFAVLGVSGMFYEITPAGQVVWTQNAGGQVGRAVKYPRDFAQGAVEPGGAAACFQLLCASPVRANGSVLISYDLPGPARVMLQAIDAAGRVAAVLVDGEQGPGRHTVALNAVRMAAAGNVCFVRFAARVASADLSTIRKLVLTK